MKKDLNEILVKLRELHPYINQKYHVHSLEVFGSFVKNRQNKNSDLDLLVSFSEIPSILKFLELKNYLSDQLKINVVLVMKDSLKPRISKNILNESITI